MIKFSTKFQDVNKVLKNLQNKEDNIYKNIRNEFDKSANRIVIEAKKTIIRNNNIITGKLLNSIYANVKERKKVGKLSSIELKVGTNVFYAIYVERKFPFLFPSFEIEKPVLMRNLKNIV